MEAHSRQERTSSHRPVVTVFIDGLRYDSLEHMDYLNSMQSRRPLRTTLGYSLTCHASMYSGVYPSRHLVWFAWQLSPATSPYRWLPDSPYLDKVDFLGTRMLIGKTTRMFSRNSSYGGLPVMKRSTLRSWRYFDATEHSMCYQPGYLGPLPTVFDLLTAGGRSWKSVGLLDAKHRGGSLSHIEDFTVGSQLYDWLYLFIGELDSVSHFHRQDSEEAHLLLRRIDSQIERTMRDATRVLGEEPILICLSDHGHIPVSEKVDVYELFASTSRPLDSMLHVVDTNFVRFWCRDRLEEKHVRDVLGSTGWGWFLTPAELQRFHVVMPDNRYGTCIFYLDRPRMFKRTAWGYGLRTVSIHGYLPDYPEKDGVFVTNENIPEQGHVELVDFLPSLLSKLDMVTPDNLDGRSVW